MPDEKPPEEPRKTRPVPKDRRQGMNVETYEYMVQAYLGGARSARQLKAATGVNVKTCLKAISVGWPHLGWPSLRERAQLWDRRAQAEARSEQKVNPVLTPGQVVDAALFREMRTDNLNISKVMRALAFRMARRVMEAVDRATADRVGKRTRVVQVKVGKRTVDRVVTEDVTLPPALTQLASAARDLGALAFEAGRAERDWARVAPPEGAEEDRALGWDGLTDEQLDAIVANEGRLPQGMTLEQLRRQGTPT